MERKYTLKLHNSVLDIVKIKDPKEGQPKGWGVMVAHENPDEPDLNQRVAHFYFDYEENKNGKPLSPFELGLSRMEIGPKLLFEEISKVDEYGRSVGSKKILKLPLKDMVCVLPNKIKTEKVIVDGMTVARPLSSPSSFHKILSANVNQDPPITLQFDDATIESYYTEDLEFMTQLDPDGNAVPMVDPIP